MDSNFIHVVTLLGLACTTLISATTVITASYTGQDEESFVLGSNATFTCTISLYTGSLTWKVDSVPVAECGFVACAENVSNPDRYSFMHNTSAGIFIFTISNVKNEDNGKVIECFGGSITDTDTLTMVVVTACPKSKGVDSTEKCSRCVLVVAVVSVVVVAVAVAVVVRKWRKRKESKPDPPKEFSLIDDSVTDTSAGLQWIPAFNNGYRQSWLLTFTANGRQKHCWINADGRTPMQHTLSNLSEGTYYSVTISAENMNGQSSLNSPLNFRTKGKPDPPRAFSLIDDSVTSTSVGVQWKPGLNGGYPQTFILTVDGRQLGSPISDIGQDQLEHTLCNLSKGKNYSVTIFAQNIKGHSSLEGPLKFRTKDKPDPPRAFSLIDDSVTSTSVGVQWKPGLNGGYPQTFILTVDGRQLGSPISDTGQDQLEHTLCDLSSGKNYSVTIFAQNIEGHSSLQGPLKFRTKAKPDPPRELRLIDDSVTETSVGFQWKPGFNGEYPQAFILIVDGRQLGPPINDTGQDPMKYTLYHLTKGTYYSVTIFAKNTKGQSLLDGPLTFKTKGSETDSDEEEENDVDESWEQDDSEDDYCSSDDSTQNKRQTDSDVEEENDVDESGEEDDSEDDYCSSDDSTQNKRQTDYENDSDEEEEDDVDESWGEDDSEVDFCSPDDRTWNKRSKNKSSTLTANFTDSNDNFTEVDV